MTISKFCTQLVDMIIKIGGLAKVMFPMNAYQSQTFFFSKGGLPRVTP